MANSGGNSIPGIPTIPTGTYGQSPSSPIGVFNPIGTFGPTGEPDPELSGLPQWPSGGTVPSLQVGSRIVIASVEYTQSTQFNGTTTPGYGNDNSVPLVAYKTMVARVYPTVRKAQFGNDALTGSYVTGDLTLSIGDRVVYTTGPTRSSGVRIGSVGKIDRSLWDREITVFGGGIGQVTSERIEINCPLNFVIPAYFCKRGRIYATVRLWPVAVGPMSAIREVRTEYLQFIDVQAPKVCLVRVNWTDSAGTVNSPTDAQMLGTLNLASRMLPFPYFETTILGTEISSSAAFAPPATNGGCNPAWNSLTTTLNVTRIFTALFQLGDIVYGMVPTAAIPAGATSINSGCGRGAGGGFVNYQSTFAHELGHLYGRAHVAVPGDTSNDTKYPNYGGSSTSIGEVGIDTGTSPPTLFDPSTNGDIMSYSSNQWISPYTYQSILDARGLHQSQAIDPKRLRPILILTFRMYRASLGSERIELKTVAHVKAAGVPPAHPAHAVSPVSVDLLDSNKRILWTHHCMYVAPHGGGNCGCNCGGGNVPLDREPWIDFAEAIEWPDDEVSSIAFHQGDDSLYTVEVGKAPEVAIAGPEQQEDKLVVRIRTSHPRKKNVSVVVLFSSDDGLTWQPIAFDPPDGLVEIERSRLSGGEHCFFRAIGTAELRSTTADTERFSLPRTTRRLYLDVPSGECAIPVGPVSLSAFVDTRGLGQVAPQEVRWSSSLDGDLGTGYSITPFLNEGKHELAVTVPNGAGGTLTTTGIIIVGGRSR